MHDDLLRVTLWDPISLSCVHINSWCRKHRFLEGSRFWTCKIRIQKGANLSSFAYTYSQNHLRGSMWMNLLWMVWNYFLRSSLLVLEKESIRKRAQSIGYLIHQVQLSCPLSNSFPSLSCTGFSTITSSLSESNYCAVVKYWNNHYAITAVIA